MFNKEKNKISYIENDKVLAYVAYPILYKNVAIINNVYIDSFLKKEVKDELFDLMYKDLKEQNLKVKYGTPSIANFFNNKLFKEVEYKEISPFRILGTFILGFSFLIFFIFLCGTINCITHKSDMLGAFVLLVFGLIFYFLPFIVITIYYISLIVLRKFIKYDYINISLYILIIIEVLINIIIIFSC